MSKVFSEELKTQILGEYRNGQSVRQQLPGALTHQFRQRNVNIPVHFKRNYGILTHKWRTTLVDL